ncbi:phage tail tape measure protein [bacterium]|nr:phage tail tape measure protein [bacterium]
MPDGVNLGSIFASLDLDISGLTVGVERAKREIASMGNVLTGTIGKNQEQLRSSMTQLGTIVAGLGVAISGGLGVGVKEAANFERQMRNVNSISKLSESTLSSLGNSVKKLAGDIGKAPEDLAAGLYDIASSGFQGAAGLEVLKQSATGAKAGLSDTATAAKGLTGVLNAYGLSASDAQRIMDIMFRTVDRGVINFQEMASTIGGVISTAAAAGIGFEEVGAAIATLTKAGNPAAEAVTALNNTINQIISPSKEAQKIAAKLGLDWLAAGKGADEIKRVGLSGVMDKIREATGGNIAVIARMMPELRSLKGALGLTRQEGSAFAEDLNAMRNASGATAAALKEQSKGLSETWEKTVASLKNLAISLGNALLPALKTGATWIGNLAKTFTSLPEGAQKTIAIIAAVAAALTGLVGTILVVGAQIGAMIGGVAAAGIGIGAIAGPVGIVIGVLAALGVAIYGITKASQALNRDTAAEAKTAADSARTKEDQARKTQDLVREYEQLRDKTNRTKEESTRMHDILQQIWRLNPDLVSSYDAQRGALGLVADAYDRAKRSAKEYHQESILASYDAQKMERNELQREAAGIAKEKKEWKRTMDTAVAYAKGSALPIESQIPSRVIENEARSSYGLPAVEPSVFDDAPPQNKEQKKAHAKAADEARKKYNILDARERQIQNRISEIKSWMDVYESGKEPPTNEVAQFKKQNPINASTSGGGKGSDGRDSKSTAAERAIKVQENRVHALNIAYDKAASSYNRMLETGRLDDASKKLKEMNDLTLQLVAAENALASAQNKAAKTPEEHKKISLDTSEATSRDAMRYMNDKKQLSEKKKELSEKDRRDEEKAAAEQEKAQREAAERAAAIEQATIDMLRSQGNEEAAVIMERDQQIAQMISKGVDKEMAVQVAKAEADRKLKDYTSRRASEDRDKQIKRLDYDREHGGINVDEYVQSLQTMQQATEQYSDEWFSIQDKIESAVADKAQMEINEARRVGKVHHDTAISMLETSLKTYQAMGDAGVDACKRIQEAIDDLKNMKREDSKETQRWYDGYVEVIGNIRTKFVSAIADMIQGIGSLRDFWKATWRAILEYAINAMLQLLVESVRNAGGIGKVLGDVFGGVKANMIAGLAQIAAQAAGVMAIFGGNKKKRKKGLFGGLLALGASFIPGVNMAATLGTFMTGAGIGAAFDNPLNDTAASRYGATLARSNADLKRLIMQGANSELGAIFPRGINGQSPKATEVHNNTPITITQHIDKVSGIEDLAQAGESLAWVVGQRLGLAPTS